MEENNNNQSNAPQQPSSDALKQPDLPQAPDLPVVPDMSINSVNYGQNQPVDPGTQEQSQYQANTQNFPPPAFTSSQNNYTQSSPQEPMYRPQNGYKPNFPYPGKGLCIASLVLGICSFVFYFVGFITATIGLVLGLVGIKKANEVGAPTGMGKAGVILSIVALALSILLIGFIIAGFFAMSVPTAFGSVDVWW